MSMIMKVSSLYNKFKHISLDNIIETNKIFLDHSKYIEMHYYASISGCYCNERKSAYDACKYLLLNNWKFIENTISNLQFCIPQFKQDSDKKPLVDFFIHYINNGSRTIAERENAWKIIKDIMKEEYPDKYDLLEKTINKKSINEKNIDKSSKYASSNKILVYTGWMTHLWNESHLENKALGGSEKAVAYLTRELPKNYEIIVSGDVEEGIFDNVTYIHQNKLQNLLDKTEFHTIIISRYINFLTEYNNLKCFQLILSLHDTHILNNGNNANHLLERYNTIIDTVITLTNWHKSHIITLYPSLNPDKIKIINNGIDVSQFNNNNSNNKIKNKFVWSSRSERGLHIILNLWREITEKLPDATLDICSYGDFPINEQDNQMLKIINSYNSITYHGKLNTKELYDLMSISEYWLYTTNFTETSCITAMEMLMSQVICLYYPLAGLLDTVGDYGISVNQGEEIDTLIHLTTEKKALMREKGKEYALSCSWKNRADEWSTILGLNKKKWVFYYDKFTIETISQYINNQSFFCGNEYNILISNNKDEIINWQPNKLSFIFSLFDETILKSINNTNNNFEVSLLQTEPLNLSWRLNSILNFHKIYPNIKIYDYSKSNIKILSKYNITNCEYLSYNIQSYELSKLTSFLTENVNNRIYDFGFIYNWKSLPIDEQHIINPPRRRNVVDFLRKNGFKVNIIAGYGDDRDIELSKCKIILNIHGQINNNNNPGPDECSNIFEHIRCDRLLKAGFIILSEKSDNLDIDFINKYSNLKCIDYNEFFNIDIINNILNNTKKIDETKKIDDTKIDDTKIDDTKIDDTKIDDTKIDDTKIDDTKIDETKKDDTKIDETKIDDNIILNKKIYNMNNLENEYNINNLMLQYGQDSNTDKVTHHKYHNYYEPILKPFYDLSGSIVEIGLGTGVSLPMWKKLFKHAHIYGIDKEYENSGDDKYTIYKADQSNIDDLNKLKDILTNKNVFFINDDGSHIPEHQLLTFNTLFPILVEGGYYIIEDIETSYWTKGECYNYKTYYGYKNNNSIIEIFKEVADIVNQEFIKDSTQLSNKILHYDYIDSVTFARNCIIIKKKYTPKRPYRFAHFL